MLSILLMRVENIEDEKLIIIFVWPDVDPAPLQLPSNRYSLAILTCMQCSRSFLMKCDKCHRKQALAICGVMVIMNKSTQ